MKNIQISALVIVSFIIIALLSSIYKFSATGKYALKPNANPDQTYFGNKAVGDINGDGIPDKAYLIIKDGGGSGTFFYVVAEIATKNGFATTGDMFIGDRISPQTTEIKNGNIIVNYADRAINEPMTATPSIGKSLYVHYDAKTNSLGELVQNFEGETNITPKPSPKPIDGGGIACSMEALACPDGSYVGRSGPNCEFAKCPSGGDSIQGGNGLMSIHVSIGPFCPVQQAGVPCEVPASAYTSRQVLVYDSTGLNIISRNYLDSTGNYSVAISAGNYFVQISPAGIGPGEKKPVSVKAGQTVNIDFNIDTGIR